MNNRYLKLLITSGIKALTGAAALAAAAAILKSDDKKEPQNSEKEVPKPEKAPKAAPEAVTAPKKPSENAAYYAAQTAQAKKAAPQADIPEPQKPECSEKPENSSPQTDWDKWEIIYRRFTNRPPVKRERIYVPDYLWEIKTVEIPKIFMTEREAEAFGYSFRKKSKRIRITNYHGSEKSIIIPEYIGGMLVNEIGANAFTNSCAERVAIPDNIKKLGESAFAESNVRFVIFGKGVREIPKMCFYGCKDLKVAAIPPLTEKLGEKAFFGCVSLKYIELPWELRYIGEGCFCGSGLEGFAARFWSGFYPDGSAFADTPLHKNTGLVLYRKYDPSKSWEEMMVLLVGYNVNVNFKESRVRLGRNSVCAPCTLDFTKCERFWTDGAFKYKPEYIDETERTPNINIYLPKNYCGSFPCFVKTNGDRSTWCENLNAFRRSETNELRITSDLCPYLLSELNIYSRENLTLVSNNDRTLKIENHAVSSSWLRKIRFAGEFTPNEDSCIFDLRCASLREVKWQSFAETPNGRQTAEYIHFLPAYAVRPDVHRELLKAFCGDGNGRFFDHKVIENIFDNGIIRSRSKTRMTLSHREKILIAIDVLRSSPELYPDGTEKYSQFLKRYFNYAKKMCAKLRGHPEYLEFLNRFAPEQGDVQ